MVVLGKVNICIFLMNDISVDCCHNLLCKKQNVQVLFCVNVFLSLSGVIEKMSFFSRKRRKKEVVKRERKRR